MDDFQIRSVVITLFYNLLIVMNDPVRRDMAECNGCPVAPGAASKCLKCDGCMVEEGEQSERAHVGGVRGMHGVQCYEKVVE